MSSFTSFRREAWIEYGIGVFVLLVRFFARWRIVGLKGWQGDDYFALLVLIFWTAEVSMLDLIGQYGTNIGYTDEQRAHFSAEQTRKLEIGSKCLLAGWCCYVTLIWCLKACVLFFFNRITMGLNYQRLVKITAIVCVNCYIAVMVIILAHCRPIHKNWQVYPDPGSTCTVDRANYLSVVVTNMSTDALIVCIPLPLLWRVKITITRKLIIGLLLCSGIFIMAAALLRCVLSLRDIKGINNSTIWAIRETFVGIIAVNAAPIKPLFSERSWIGYSRDTDERYNTYDLSKAESGIGQRLTSLARSRNRSRSKTDKLTGTASEEVILGSFEATGYRHEISGGKRSDEASQATEIQKGEWRSASRADYEMAPQMPGVIRVTTTLEIT
ncbi:hypothetical protein MPDQ_005603 [Monascus purpureus]|uniref:Rhodopsin domain-containing protein n=1 Tax=Monascus purpureus TaxID=5098 RepID=A0A507QW54_MONPU|nr:hypothetical protein MPDQ_005603 [Monascus purpureus]BDD56231.1 hypothetical protein MAP00_001705 [Monascus purpureus]